MSVLDVLTLAVLTFVGVRLFEVARVSVATRARVLGIVRGLRPRHFLLAIPVLAVVLVAALLLVQLPVLSFGWWTAIGGEGNPVIGSTSRTQGSPLEVIVPLCFLALLLVGLPLLVETEEWVFRRGAQLRSRWANLRRAVLFGLAHALVGIPVGAAIALSIGGVYLTRRYLRGWRRTNTEEGALLESTRAHLGYNLVIIVVVAVALALGG